MSHRTVSIFLLGICLVPGICFTGYAGGSVEFEQVRRLLPAEVRAHLDASFEIEEVGDATRLGRQFTHLGGARVGPYHFPATSKARGGGRCEITFVTRVSFVDGQGRAVEEPGRAEDVVEEFQHLEVRFGEPAPEKPAAPPRLLSAREKEQVVAGVRSVYAEVNKMELRQQKGEFEEEEQSFELRRGISAGGTVRKVEFLAVAGDHGGFSLEIFCDGEARPAFVLWEDSHWRFDPDREGRTIDFFTERRFYFSPDGQLARALEKEYSGSGEGEIERARDRAVNRQFEPDPAGVTAFHGVVTEIANCVDETKLPALTESFWKARDAMLGQQ